MLNKDMIEDIFFNEIINEANKSEVSIIEADNLEHLYNIGFNACIEGKLNSGNISDSKPILMINNKKQLINMLEEYINEVDKTFNYFSNCEYKQKIKAYMAFVWNNAIYEDFASPCTYLKKQIDFLKNPKFDLGTYSYADNIDFSAVMNSKNKSAINLLSGSSIITTVRKQGIKAETPFVFEVKITSKDTSSEYLLPSISYGISNNECYIYAIQDKNNSKDSTFSKSVNRILYSLNSDILDNESLDYKSAKGNNIDEYDSYHLNKDDEIIYDYFPENISKVSPSAIIALTVFLDSLSNIGMDKVKVVSCLPIRYYGKEIFYLKKHKYMVNKDNLTKEEANKLLLEYKKEHLRIQRNLSEKLIRNFRRLEHHFNNCFISSYPLELDEYLHFRFREFNLSNNLLLNSIIDSKVEHKIK